MCRVQNSLYYESHYEDDFLGYFSQVQIQSNNSILNREQRQKNATCPIIINMKRRQEVQMIQLDFSKAFDIANQEKMVDILKKQQYVVLISNYCNKTIG